MRLKVILVLIILSVSGCRSWYQEGVKFENAKKDGKLAAETEDFEYSMFLRGYEKVKPPTGIKTETFFYKGKLITVAGE